MTRLLPPLRVLALLLALHATACAPAAARPAADPARDASARSFVSDRLYFGRAVPGGGTVSDEEWSRFLSDVVTPRFPAGLTVWRAEGQWRDGSGEVVREASFVLELIHRADAGADEAIRGIVAEYKRRFRQEAVLHVRDRVEVRF